MSTEEKLDKAEPSEKANLLNNLKKHPLITVLIAVAAVVSGIATFTDSISKIWSSIEPRITQFQGPATISVEPAGKFSWPQKALLDNSEFRISSWDDRRYSIALHVIIRFEKDRFNSIDFFRGIENLTVANLKSMNIISEARGNFEPENRRVNTTLFLKFKEKPYRDEVFVIRTANFSKSFILSGLNWERYPLKSKNISSGNWYGAQAHLEIIIPDPDWPVLRLVRLIRGSPPLLEILIDNRSPDPLPVNNIVINASHPRLGGIPCADGDPPQRVVLSWPRTIEAQSGSTSWTEIANQRVDVQTVYSYKGYCSNFSFRAIVPVTNVVPPKKIARLTLSISELPEREGHDGFSIPLLGSITNWSSFSVIVDPSNEVFPNELSVSR